MDYADWGTISRLDYEQEDFLQDSLFLQQPRITPSVDPLIDDIFSSFQQPSLPREPVVSVKKCLRLLPMSPGKVHHRPPISQHILNKRAKPLEVCRKKRQKIGEKTLFFPCQSFLDETEENEKKKIFLGHLIFSFFSRKGRNKKLEKGSFNHLVNLKIGKWNVVCLEHSCLNLKGRVKVSFSSLASFYEITSQILVDSKKMVCFQFFVEKIADVRKKSSGATLEIYLDDILCYQREIYFYGLGSSSGKVQQNLGNPISQLIFHVVQQVEGEKKWCVWPRIEKSSEETLVSLLRKKNVLPEEIVCLSPVSKKLAQDCSLELSNLFKNSLQALKPV